MSMNESDDDRKRLDPYDPRTGATGNDEIDDDESEGEESPEGEDEDLGD